jgi:hypothetical protein
VVFDKGPELDDSWADENVGVINIKSVYDMGDTSFDGCFFGLCETSPSAINSVSDFADPLNANADQRPVRFVRFITPVGIPDPDDIALAAALGVDPPDLDNQAFGRQRELGMRAIVGYAPVEPDGSVKVKVPANLPLGVEVLDAEGRRIGPRHLNWFQVLPGDTLTCNGCHVHPVGSTPEVHGRTDGTAPSINNGILPPTYIRTQIPGTIGPYSNLNLGETMAEARFYQAVWSVPEAPEPRLDADLNFVDYWTDPTDLLVTPVPAVPYSYSYDDLDLSISSPAPPANPLFDATKCKNPTPPIWRNNCRITINYPRHIHPIWQLTRIDDMGTPLDPADDVDNTCIGCHTTVVAAVTQVPAGQLNLTTDPAQNPNQFFRAYLELLFTDQAEMLDAGGNLVDIDPAVGVNPSMTANGARSSFFIEQMTGTELDAPRGLVVGTVDHTNMLTGAELKLISEWLDLGAQNFNDPFDPAAPQN